MVTSEIYNLDRKAASRLLKVSIRTVDRYIRTKKLSTKLINGRIWLDRRELAEFRSRQSGQAGVDNVDMSTSHLSIDNLVDNGVDNVDSEVDTSPDRVEILNQKSISESARKTKSDGGVYKKLYEDLKLEVQEKQARLEIANYRVGQLETQVKNSIPLLEYHQEKYEKKKKEARLEKDLKQNTELLERLSFKLQYAKFSKKIFLTVLLLVLALQPLWLLLILPSN